MTEKEFTDIAANLRNLAFKHGRSYVGADEAEDVAQDTMLRLWSLHKDLPSTNKAKALAVTIARHLAIDRLRRQKTVPLDTLQGAVFVAVRNGGLVTDGHKARTLQVSPDSSLEEKENEQWLRRHLKKLPSNEYQVLHLRQVEKKSNQEIASILGIKPESVPVLLSRARRKLYEEIKKRI